MRTLVTKLVAFTLLLLAGLIAGAASGERQAEPGDKTPHLAEGDGRGLVFEACVQCHDLKIIVSQRKTAAGWRRTVNEMIWRGAPLLADEVEPVVKYLTQAFGPEKKEPEGAQEKAKKPAKPAEKNP